MAQASSKTCEICMSGPGHNYCEQCDQLFCGGCKISHLRTKMSKNHIFRGGPNISLEEYCKEHDSTFIYYCMDCSTPICKTCCVKNHKSHDFADITESTENIKVAVMKDIETKIGNFQSNEAEIEQGSINHQAEIKEVINDIREEGRLLKKLIDDKVESLIESLKEKETKNLQMFLYIGNELKTAVGKAKEQHNLHQDAEGIQDTTILLQKLKTIKSQIDQIKEIQVPIMPSVKYAKKMGAESDIEELFGEVTFGETVKREGNPKHEKNVSVTTTAKQYRYRCRGCGTESLSEEEP